MPRRPLWAVGLSERSSATRAAKWGGIAAFIAAARIFLGIALLVGASDKTLAQAVAWTFGASVVPFIFAIAGVRMMRGSGRLSGSIAVAIMAADFFTMTGPISPVMIGTIVARIALMFFMLNGIRGAVALKFVDYNADLRDPFRCV